MRCGHCGVESPAGMSFCGSCGFALSHGPLPFEQATGHGTAQRRHVTVMFCDLVDSTPLAELLVKALRAAEEHIEATGERLTQSELARAARRHQPRRASAHDR